MREVIKLGAYLILYALVIWCVRLLRPLCKQCCDHVYHGYMVDISLKSSCGSLWWYCSFFLLLLTIVIRATIIHSKILGFLHQYRLQENRQHIGQL